MTRGSSRKPFVSESIQFSALVYTITDYTKPLCAYARDNIRFDWSSSCVVYCIQCSKRGRFFDANTFDTRIEPISMCEFLKYWYIWCSIDFIFYRIFVPYASLWHPMQHNQIDGSPKVSVFHVCAYAYVKTALSSQPLFSIHFYVHLYVSWKNISGGKLN